MITAINGKPFVAVFLWDFGKIIAIVCQWFEIQIRSLWWITERLPHRECMRNCFHKKRNILWTVYDPVPGICNLKTVRTESAFSKGDAILLDRWPWNPVKNYAYSIQVEKCLNRLNFDIKLLKIRINTEFIDWLSI